MKTKTCSTCRATLPADHTNFDFKTRKRKDGSTLRGLRSACRQCERENARIRGIEKRQGLPDYNREVKRRQREAPGYKAKKNDYDRERRARAAGYTSSAERAADRERVTAARALSAALKALAKSTAAAKLQPWQRPGITPAQAWRLRYRLDPEFNIAERLRRQINKKAKRDGVGDLMREALKRGGESNAVQAAMGYSIAELRAHLERQFTDGMTWAKFIAGKIHIDHITAQAEFDLRNVDEWRACWSLGNLRPMWAADNLAKSAARHFLL